MDEEALFRDIHHHILRQAKAGERIDTETELATRFNVTRYKVRKALSVLSQMGVVDRAPKRGMTVNALGPKNLSAQIQVQMDIANFDIREFIEARQDVYKRQPLRTPRFFLKRTTRCFSPSPDPQARTPSGALPGSRSRTATSSRPR